MLGFRRGLHCVRAVRTVPQATQLATFRATAAAVSGKVLAVPLLTSSAQLWAPTSALALLPEVVAAAVPWGPLTTALVVNAGCELLYAIYRPHPAFRWVGQGSVALALTTMPLPWTVAAGAVGLAAHHVIHRHWQSLPTLGGFTLPLAVTGVGLVLYGSSPLSWGLALGCLVPVLASDSVRFRHKMMKEVPFDAHFWAWKEAVNLGLLGLSTTCLLGLMYAHTLPL